MDKSEYALMYKLEKNLWWYKGMRKITENLLRKCMKEKGKILDAGCGTGMNMQFLSSFGEVFGIDLSTEALSFCRERGLTKLKKNDVQDIKFPDNTFDLVTSFDVIYHMNVKDDVKALSEFRRVVKPGGLVFIRVPAGTKPYSRHDEVVHTARRYKKKVLAAKLKQAGLKPIKISYAHTFLFPAVVLVRWLENILNIKPKSDLEKTSNQVANFVFTLLLNIEAMLLPYIDFPIGVSLIAIAKKPES